MSGSTRIVAYALGGGLGHVTRSLAVLDALGRREDCVGLLASVPQAADPRLTGGVPVCVAPRELERDRAGLARWVADQLVALAPTRLLVDAFPAGVLGELGLVRLPAAVSLAHTARLLRWEVYRRRIAAPIPRYSRIWTVEDLHVDHARALDAHQRAHRATGPERLELPPVASAAAGAAERDLGWLVVHSGPPVEVMELAAYADRERQALAPDAPITVVCPSPPAPLPANATHVDAVPARALFARAERIVTAGGFNLVRETEPYRDRHEAVPLPRALDDQFTRVARLRTPAPAI